MVDATRAEHSGTLAMAAISDGPTMACSRISPRCALSGRDPGRHRERVMGWSTRSIAPSVGSLRRDTAATRAGPSCP